jgi:hypothetical protein
LDLLGEASFSSEGGGALGGALLSVLRGKGIIIFLLSAKTLSSSIDQ